MTNRAGRWVCVLAVGLAVASGCAQPVPPKPAGSVSGKVTFQDKAVTKGIVAFTNNQGGAGTGEIDAEGNYTIASLPVGDYKVMVQPKKPELSKDDYDKVMKGEMQPPAGDAPDIPPKYRAVDTTDLTAIVKEGPNTVNLPMK